MDLRPPYIHYLNAASGWAELGLVNEAVLELNRIPDEFKLLPSVLEVEWQICAVSKNWEKALKAAEKQVELFPQFPSGWVNQSFALHELKRTEEAWNRLNQILKKFPDVSIIPYNLACYACQLGKLAESKTLLEKAVEAGDGQEIRKMALEDTDLKPLWASFKEPESGIEFI